MATEYLDKTGLQKLVSLIKSRIIPVDKGGTGLMASPSMLVNLASTDEADVLQASPRPGVTGTLPVARGGTGATSGTDALNNLGIKTWLLNNVFKVGYVWVSYTNASPASIVGGTWTPIKGYFPYFNTGTGTGGSNSHTHGLSKGAAAVHMETGSGSAHDMVFGFRPASGITFSPSYKHFLSASSGGPASEALNTPAQLVGSTASSNNMPAYQTLYAWRRTA